MHESMTLLWIVLVILGYGYFSRLLARLNISGPMVFVTVGILLSPLGFGSEPVHLQTEAVKIVAEIALIIILFSDASGIDMRRLKEERTLPFRLLFVALPMTILTAAGAAGLFFPDEEALYWLLIALVLAPTDAALGKAVVTDTRLPERIRNTINVESGLNDGIVFPLFITVVTMIALGEGGEGWALYLTKQILLGAIAGAIVGRAGAWLSRTAASRGWMAHQYANLIPVALAIFSYYLAEFFGGNGFIAAYLAGFFAGNYDATVRRGVEEFAESEGEFLVMLSFLVFGLAFVPVTVEYWSNPAVWGYALLSLTLFRMFPAWLALAGTSTDGVTRLFLGWFGPRGIASILYVLIAVERIGDISGHERLFGVISLTIFLSIFLHGFSASPLTVWYASYLQKRR